MLLGMGTFYIYVEHAGVRGWWKTLAAPRLFFELESPGISLSVTDAVRPPLKGRLKQNRSDSTADFYLEALRCNYGGSTQRKQARAS